MGTSHAAMGAAAGAIACGVAGTDVTTAAAVIGVTSVSALLPDLDHPSAKLSRALGPVGWVVSRVVSRVGGGHRGLTHSLLGLVLAGVILVPVVAVTGWPWWMLGAIVLGCATHILGDMCTESGVPLGWPNRRDWRIATLDTGGWVEAVTVVPACTVIIGLTTYDNLTGGLL
jgi:inner membrane protein